MAGKLQVSVIEARNVSADLGSDPDFYVRLRYGTETVKTDVVKNSLAPKFLKDIRLDVETLEAPLQVDMMQVGPKGDLVIGSTAVEVSSLSDTGTLVQWFPLKDAAKKVAAELCLVLRVSSGSASPSASPSHTLLAERTKAAALAREQQEKEQREAQEREREAALAREKEKAQAAIEKEKKRAEKERDKAKRRQHRKQAEQLPMPLVVAGAVLVALGASLWSVRPRYYEVQEGDTLCEIGYCHNRKVDEIYRKNSHIVTDPNVIYPGDRLKLR